MEHPDLYVITGHIGTGKTTTARQLEAQGGVQMIDRDLIREELGIFKYDPSDAERIDQQVWARVLKGVQEHRPVSVGAASLVRESKRRQLYAALQQISTQVHRRLDAIWLECVCPSEEARRRIKQRNPEGAATSDPSDYDKLWQQATPLSPEEMNGQEGISFVTWDTSRFVMEPLKMIDRHRKAAEALAILLRNQSPSQSTSINPSGTPSSERVAERS